MRLHIGTAGWAIPRASKDRFEATGTHLQRYARRFNSVEINSCFYRPHLEKTYVRWRESTPDDFRFAVKLPRRITHELKLQRARAPLVEFLEQTSGLGAKRGPILVQLPPSLAYDARVAARFFVTVRSLYAGPLVFEPRHPTWFAERADALLRQHRVSRVAADPPRDPADGTPAGWPATVYYRLHGSPRTYWSKYDASYLDALSNQLRQTPASADVWCIFDNTALGAAIENAWELQDRVTSAALRRRTAARTRR